MLKKSDKVIDNVLGLVDLASMRMVQAAENQMGLTEFRLTLKSLQTLINDVYQDVKTMGSPRYRNVKVFQDYARGTLVNYYMMLDDAESASKVVDKFRNRIMKELGEVIDEVYHVSESKPPHKLFKRITEKEQNDFLSLEYQRLVPEWSRRLVNFCMDMMKVLKLADDMSDRETLSETIAKPGGEET